MLLLLLLNALDAKSANYESPRALSRTVVETLTNGEAVSPSYLNPSGSEGYKGAVYKFIA